MLNNAFLVLLSFFLCLSLSFNSLYAEDYSNGIHSEGELLQVDNNQLGIGLGKGLGKGKRKTKKKTAYGEGYNKNRNQGSCPSGYRPGRCDSSEKAWCKDMRTSTGLGCRSNNSGYNKSRESDCPSGFRPERCSDWERPRCRDMRTSCGVGCRSN